MKSKKVLVVLIACCLMLAALPSSAIPNNSQTGTLPDLLLPESYVEAQILVGMEQPLSLAGHGANPNINPFQGNLDIVSITDLTDISEFARGHGAISPAPYQGRQILLVELDENEDILEAITTLESDPLVSYAEPNLIGRLCSAPPSNPYSGGIWNYDKIGADTISSITGGSPDIRTGILDSGMNEHPALAACIDYDLAWNFLTCDSWRYSSHEEIQDDNGHGTFVAGVAAGVIGNNDEGFIEKLSDVKLIPLSCIRHKGTYSAIKIIGDKC